MKQFETIHWTALPGNKYTKSLDPAMITEQGCITPGKVRHCHDPKGRVCNVVYDRNYVVQFLIKRFLYVMSVFGKETIDELIDEAWETLYPQEDSNEEVKQIAS